MPVLKLIENEILLTMDGLAENLRFDRTEDALAEAAQLRAHVLQRQQQLRDISDPASIRAMDRLAVIKL